jgi:hypothetical protein
VTEPHPKESKGPKRLSGTAGLRRAVSPLLIAGLLSTGCGDGATAPGEIAGGTLVLNSTGQTLVGFAVEADGLRRTGSEIDLGASFDGDAVDVRGRMAVTTVSSFAGSRVYFVDLENGVVETVVFPGSPSLDSTLVNPSRATFAPDGAVWVGGRGSDAIYRVDVGSRIATKVADGVGTFVQRVLPVDDRLYAIDGNIDDDGFTFLPFGPSRVAVLSTDGRQEAVVNLPTGAVGAVDAVIAHGRLVVLAAGSFDPDFAPNGDGALVTIELSSLAVAGPFPLGGNGLSIEIGRDSLVYVTRTTDFASIRTLSFDAGAGRFVRGPANPIPVVDGAGEPVSCWAVTAIANDRLLCVTFRFDAPGRLVMARRNGQFIDEVPSGFGSTDIQLR